MPIPDQPLHEQISNMGGKFWRYMSLDHLANILRTEKLLFRRVSEFSDPFEGALPNAYREKQKEAINESEDLPDDFLEVYSAANERIREFVYANCWHHNYRESEAMWQSYGKKGVAIVTKADSIFESLESEERMILFREIEYLNYYDSYDELSPSEQNSLNEIFNRSISRLFSQVKMKRKSFKHENEFRLLRPEVDLIPENQFKQVDANIALDDEKWRTPIFAHLDGKNGAIDLRNTPKGNKRMIDVNLDTLIEEIRITPNSDEWFKKTVEELVNSMGPDSITSERVRASDTDLNEQIF